MVVSSPDPSQSTPNMETCHDQVMDDEDVLDDVSDGGGDDSGDWFGWFWFKIVNCKFKIF